MAEAKDDRLLLLVQRIERIDEEIAGLRSDRKDVFAEAKAVGYDTRVLRTVIARRAMKPDDRAEADAMVETYEAALGGLAPDPAVTPEEAQRELAIAILAEQVEGIQDEAQAAALADHVAVLLDIRAEIAALRKAEAARKKLAEQEGFQKRPLAQLVRWIEKCAKRGTDVMRAGEAVFQLYRGTIEARGIGGAAKVSDDPKLQAMTGKKDKKLDAVLAWATGGNE